MGIVGWDSEFKALLEEQMKSIVTKAFRQKLGQKYSIQLDRVWSIDKCNKVLGAAILKQMLPIAVLSFVQLQHKLYSEKLRKKATK